MSKDEALRMELEFIEKVNKAGLVQYWPCATLEELAGLVAAEIINKAEDYGLGTDAVEHLKEYFGVE